MTDLLPVLRLGLPRPQPIGVLPLPAGGLLLPDVPGAADVAADLVRGVQPTTWPAGLEFVRLALDGDIEGALTRLAGASDPVLRLDAFVLDPTETGHAELERSLTDPSLRTLLAVAAFTAGLLDSAPDTTALDGELLAFGLLARAAEAIEHGTRAQAQLLLTEAVEAARPVVPALAAQLLGTLAELQPEHAAGLYAEGLALLPTGHQTQVRAELLYGRGVALQAAADGRAGMLKEAVRCYQQALVVFRRESHPQLFAEAQTNLALCHLATPMVEAGDTLRLGIAVQALRDALTVWDRESYPAQWASVTLNLANSLQYLPSTHQQDNLAEAVDHYEELLAVRDRSVDPLGCARVLANQGNALAHLGIGDHARVKLTDARQLFLAAGDIGAVAAVTDTLVELEALTAVARL